MKTLSINVVSPGLADITPGLADITPVSGRLYRPSIATSTVGSRRSQSSLPVCGDSFFDDSHWSQNSLNVSDSEPHDTVRILSSTAYDTAPLSSNNRVVRSCESKAARQSTCSVQHSPLTTLQCHSSAVTTQSASSESWLTSQQTSMTPVSGLPASAVKPTSSLPASAVKPTSSLSASAVKPPSSWSAATPVTASPLPG